MCLSKDKGAVIAALQSQYTYSINKLVTPQGQHAFQKNRNTNVLEDTANPEARRTPKQTKKSLIVNTGVLSLNDTKTDSINARYQRAAQFEQGAFDNSIAFNTTLYPHWIGDSDCFWYSRQSRTGHTYRLVDAAAKTNREAFDHQALCQALTQASGESLEADNLPLSDLDLSQPAEVLFTAVGQRWSYHLEQQRCEPIDRHPDNWLISPDGNTAVFARDYNLVIKDLASGEEKNLTHDGERLYEYASLQPMSVYGEQGPSVSVEALWSADSQRLFTHVIDLRQVGVGPPLVEHIPTDGSLRPTIRNPDRRVAFVGDEAIEAYQFLAIDVHSGQIQTADYRPCPAFHPPYAGCFSAQLAWWNHNSRHAYFVDQVRGGQTVNVVEFDTHTGQTRVLLQEHSDFAVTVIPITHIRALLRPLPESNELIWFSERSGSAQLYLYNLTSGELKNPITQVQTADKTPWVVRNLLHVDASRRELLIQTAGRVEGRNPYYCDICRVNMDTGELMPLLSSDDEYVVCDQRSRLSAGHPQALGVSPSGRYIVTTRSRVDSIPVSLLLDRNGTECMTLETADVSGLPDNCTWPEPVLLTAADGDTPIYGVVFRPSNFDPAQSYPILDCSHQYASPVGAFSNSHLGGGLYFSPWAYAELGFIAVVIFNRGNEGLRDTRFNQYQHPYFPMAPFNPCRCYKTDCVAGIQQLAERYPYMDTKRVGVVEFASIPTALMGMLVHPDFYQVGVSINAQACSLLEGDVAPAHSADIDWQQWPEFEQRADQLRGKLLIINGMLDWCMHVTMTFRLVAALQKANKRFDMLLLPTIGHGLCNYAVQRSWDYMVEHLRGETPPEDFKLDTPIDQYVDSAFEAQDKDKTA